MPVSVVFQEVDSNFMANQIPKSNETKSSPAKNDNNDVSKRRSRIKSHYAERKTKNMPQNDDFCIKMEESFKGDLIRQANKTNKAQSPFKPKSVNHDENDETLSLSPIKNSARADENDQTFDDLENREDSYHGRHYASAIKPLYKPPLRESQVNGRLMTERNESVRNLTIRTDPMLVKDETFAGSVHSAIRRSTNILPRKF